MVLLTSSAGSSAAAACAFAAVLAACAAPSTTVSATTSASQRVIVELVHGSVDSTAIAAEASRVAGIHVEYAAAVSASRHALFLHCAAAVACEAAIARLRAAGTTYQAVEIDGRKSRSAS